MLLNSILKLTVFKARIALINRKKELYQTVTDSSDIQNYQINRFNEVWSNAYKNIPFYQMWKEKHLLPDSIDSIADISLFPPLTKADIQDNYELIMSNLTDYQLVSTGGSTGEPTKFPTSNEESDLVYANQYLGRSWWNITSLDKILLFWGHSHLFGSGIKGKLNVYKRSLFDWVIGTHRLSAYDISDERLAHLYQKVHKLNPTTIIGYTSTIYKMAKYIDENNLPIGRKTNLQGVVVTSETVSEYDIKIIEKVFKVPCVIEYGMAETGAIAYSKNKSNNIRILWDSFIAQKSETGVLYLTTISKKLFPLINYQTNDIVESKDEKSVLTISKIIGRKNDILEIRNDNKILSVHSELFTHVLKSIPGVMNFQIIQKKNKNIIIKYVSRNNIDVAKLFFSEIEKEYSSIHQGSFTFEKVDEIEQTIAGKAKWILIEKD
ncbi:hypothetical protein [Vibrio caribbeanicus]|uniref:phenylacetate--CoA ligase family protein n=1 Tax=Vibrio caribbeanicus TaxID=701175 RepID=UPI0030D73CE8